MIADNLTICVVRTSDPMILTMYNSSVPVLHEKGFQLPLWCQCMGMIWIVDIFFIVYSIKFSMEMGYIMVSVITLIIVCATWIPILPEINKTFIEFGLLACNYILKFNGKSATHPRLVLGIIHVFFTYFYIPNLCEVLNKILYITNLAFGCIRKSDYLWDICLSWFISVELCYITIIFNTVFIITMDKQLHLL